MTKLFILSILALIGCANSADLPDESYPDPSMGTGGAQLNSSAPSTGGSSPMGTGGASSTGGAAMGGSVATGGSVSTGGVPATGGSAQTGGSSATGGASQVDPYASFTTKLAVTLRASCGTTGICRDDSIVDGYHQCGVKCIEAPASGERWLFYVFGKSCSTATGAATPDQLELLTATLEDCKQ
jgi:hypothetical protein